MRLDFVAMQERRRFKRHIVQKAAKVIFDRCEALMDCTVHDLSVGGACIQIENSATIQNEVELTFDAGRTLRACRIAWRSEARIGLAFKAAEPTCG
jgi:PilZ domain